MEDDYKFGLEDSEEPDISWEDDPRKIEGVHTSGCGY